MDEAYRSCPILTTCYQLIPTLTLFIPFGVNRIFDVDQVDILYTDVAGNL